MTAHSGYADIAAFVTKDGSEVRELMHPDHHTLRAQGFAEASVPPGDALVIAPGTPHCIANSGTTALKILCACAPP